MRVTKGYAAAATLVLLTGALGVVATAAPASAALAGVSSTTTNEVQADSTTALTGLHVTVGDGEQVSVTLGTTYGELTVDVGTGIALAHGYSATGSEIAFTGTGAQVNAALAAATLTTGPDDKGHSAMVSIMASPAGNVVYAPSTGHFYQYIEWDKVAYGDLSWNDALLDAEGKIFGGQSGYLATVPDNAVNELIATRINGAQNVWLGGSATADGLERVWTWKTGPRAGHEFSRCSSNAYNFLCDLVGTNGAYANWAHLEPNNWNDGGPVGESYAVTNWQGGLGRWNDLPNVADGIEGYVVEYGDSLYGSSSGFDGVYLAEAMVDITGTPDAPTGIAATSGLGTVTVSFTAPANDGGSAIDEYRVIRTPGGGVILCAGSPCDIPELAAGQEYSFVVQAHNASGWSASSAGATAQIDVVPSLPAALPTSLLQGQSFSASVATTGNPAPTYAVTAGSLPDGVSLNGATGEVAGTPTTTGAWGFSITATNTYTSSQRAYAGTTGSVPEISTMQLGTMTWQVPVDNTLAWAASPAGVGSVVDGALPAGLTLESNGRLHGTPSAVGPYSFTLAVVNTHGSAQRTFTGEVVGVPAGAPVPTAAVPGDRAVSVHFTPPALSGGFTISSYQYSLDGGATWLPRADGGSGSPLTVSGLTNGTPYTVLVRAINGGGQGEASVGITQAPAAVPSAPTITSVVAGNGSAAVRFSPPADNGGRPVRWYEYSVDGGNTWVRPALHSSASPITVYGLTNGVAYAVAVRAVSEVGPGAASVTAPASPAVAPVPQVDGAGYPELVPGKGEAAVNGETTQVASAATRDAWNLAGPNFAVTLAAYDSATRPVISDGQAGSLVAHSGGYIRTSGNGFAPGTAVDVWLFSEPTLLGTFVVKSDGTFDTIVAVPTSVAAGNHTVQVNGLSAARDTVTATLGIQVAAAAPAQLASTGSDVEFGPAIVLVLTGLGLLWVVSRRRRSVDGENARR